MANLQKRNSVSSQLARMELALQTVLNREADNIRRCDKRLAECEDEIEKLKKALKPFVDCCDQIADDESDEEWAKFRLLIKDYRRARKVYNGSEGIDG